jgi:hypothetical protein
VAARGRFESNPNLTRVYIYIYIYISFHPCVILDEPYLSHLGSNFDNFHVSGFVLASSTKQWACNHFWRL